MKNALIALASAAWSVAAISSATPADATAYTMQSGSYASCSNSYDMVDGPLPCQPVWLDVPYVQHINFVTTHCNAGSCSNENGAVYVDAVYEAGRKTATLDGQYGMCDVGGVGAMYIY